FSAQIVDPQCIPLIAFPRAWSPGTSGPLTADVVYLDVKTESDFEKYKGKVKGAIVLTGGIRDIKAWFDPPGTRLSDTTLLNLADAREPAAGGGGRRRPNPNAAPGGPNAAAAGPDNPFMAALLVQRRRLKFLVDEGAAMIVEQSRNGDGGTLFTEAAAVPQP